MANKPLKTIKFPGLDDTYTIPQVDAALATSGAAADAKKVGDELTNLKQDFNQYTAEVLGLYPQMEITDTAIVSFTDGADNIPVKSLTVDITPVQDLHGQANPWSAGGGKNKMPPRAEGTTTVGGITITTDSNGVITMNGTASELVNPGLCTAFKGLPNASVIPSIGATGFNFWVNDTTTGTNPSSGGAFTADSTHEYRVFMTIPSGTTLNNQKIYPMIRLASETDDTWQPYSNICPISGWTGAKVTRTGINQWDEQWEQGVISTSGQPETATNGIRSKNYCDCIGGKTYYVRCNQTGKFYICIFWYDNDKNFIDRAYCNGETVDAPNNAKYFKIGTNANNYIYGGAYNHDISINYPSTDTSYHSGANNETYEIDLDGTRYGGTLDVTNGVLTVDRKIFDLGDGNWSLFGNTESRQAWVGYFPDIKSPTNGNTPYDAISSAFKGVSYNASWVPGVFAPTASSSATGVAFCVESGKFADASEFKTSVTGVQFCYAVAEPQTIQLSPTEVATILGQNNIFCDTGDIAELTYRADLKAYIDAHVGS